MELNWRRSVYIGKQELIRECSDNTYTSNHSIQNVYITNIGKFIFVYQVFSKEVRIIKGFWIKLDILQENK